MTIGFFSFEYYYYYYYLGAATIAAAAAVEEELLPHRSFFVPLPLLFPS